MLYFLQSGTCVDACVCSKSIVKVAGYQQVPWNWYNETWLQVYVAQVGPIAAMLNQNANFRAYK